MAVIIHRVGDSIVSHFGLSTNLSAIETFRSLAIAEIENSELDASFEVIKIQRADFGVIAWQFFMETDLTLEFMRQLSEAISVCVFFNDEW